MIRLVAAIIVVTVAWLAVYYIAVGVMGIFNVTPL